MRKLRLDWLGKTIKEVRQEQEMSGVSRISHCVCLCQSKVKLIQYHYLNRQFSISHHPN